jgi:hypothetical protein
MKDWEINKSNRKGFGDIDPREKVHTTPRQKSSGRGAMKRELEDMVERFSNYDDDDEETGIPIRLKGGKKHTAMMALKRDKGTTVIPKGDYCYDANGKCPYWDSISNKPEQMNGYCWFTQEGDWQDGGLRWDQCKECHHNPGDEADLTPVPPEVK